MKNRLMCIFMVVFIKESTAQISEFGIGNVMPDMVLSNVVNYSSDQIRLSDFNGKILIIDFWGTTCLTCITNMPKMADLQKRFNDKIKILHVTAQSKDQVLNFYKKRKDIQVLGLPIIAQDSVLSRMFPHQTIPHIIWIGTDRKIKAITQSRYVTEQNLYNLISRNTLSLPVKKEISDFNREEPFSLANYSDREVLFYSCLTKKIDGLQEPSSITAIDTGTLKIFVANYSIVSLYFFAIQLKLNLLPHEQRNYLVLNIANQELLARVLDKELNFCYEGTMQAKNTLLNKRRALAAMQMDLDKFFNMRSTVEKKELKCYVVTIRDETKLDSGKSLIIDHRDYDEFINHPIFRLVPALTYASKSHLPIIYEGAKDKVVSIKLQKKYEKVEDMKADLVKAGLDLKECKRNIEVLVLSDNRLN